ncbi:MAG TPA: beta-ketoacyl synthase chain length factor, partial [Acetobacteraceae bacterium]|nr:beta-ketoacyl synthase chain length factor [Acetobacteraceae bacterium]
SPYQPRPSPPPPPALLAPNERRRTGAVVRLALAVAHEAALASGLPPASLRVVFGSANGDGPVIGGILEALATAGDERVVSPTQFHNSVHNAAAGYWSIATGTRLPATCIGCHDDTWAATLLVAMTELTASGDPVLLCCYDHPLPVPLDGTRNTGPLFGVALALAGAGAGPELALVHDPNGASLPALADSGLDQLAHINPAARALPLLTALARSGPSRHDLPYLEGRLCLELRP